MPKATKAELRREIAELEATGGAMAALCRSWSKLIRRLTTEDRAYMTKLYREWNAIKRAEAPDA